jgi:hypothetical protein
MDNVVINLASGAVGAILGAFAAYWFQGREFKKLGKYEAYPYRPCLALPTSAGRPRPSRRRSWA